MWRLNLCAAATAPSVLIDAIFLFLSFFSVRFYFFAFFEYFLVARPYDTAKEIDTGLGNSPKYGQFGCLDFKLGQTAK